MTQFSQSDIEQIKSHGLDIDTITQQLHNFESGFPYSDIESAAIIGNGVMQCWGQNTLNITNPTEITIAL